jgi:hypothetical protein
MLLKDVLKLSGKKVTVREIRANPSEIDASLDVFCSTT